MSDRKLAPWHDQRWMCGGENCWPNILEHKLWKGFWIFWIAGGIRKYVGWPLHNEMQMWTPELFLEIAWKVTVLLWSLQKSMQMRIKTFTPLSASWPSSAVTSQTRIYFRASNPLKWTADSLRTKKSLLQTDSNLSIPLPLEVAALDFKPQIYDLRIRSVCGIFCKHVELVFNASTWSSSFFLLLGIQVVLLNMSDSITLK